MQILQCATTNAAKTFGGEIGPGSALSRPASFADLVILNSNPIDDIAHIDIDGVMKTASSILPTRDHALSNSPARSIARLNLFSGAGFLGGIFSQVWATS